MVEGIDHQEHFSTAGTFTAQFQGDRIVIDMEPQETDRFLVLNESYHPRWRARCDGKEILDFFQLTAICASVGASGHELCPIGIRAVQPHAVGHGDRQFGTWIDAAWHGMDRAFVLPRTGSVATGGLNRCRR